MKKTIGVLAHVDAGKTTFSEQVLYRTGAIRRMGRVDHRDAFLDMNDIERARGITVFADQAVFDLGENRYYWLDTPGHEDFVAEMERVLPVLDFAVLLVSAAEGVQSHTERVWALLSEYKIPCIFFINKMDRPDADFDRCLREMRKMLSTDICDLRGFDGRNFSPEAMEAVAERDEALLERMLKEDYEPTSWRKGLARLLRTREIFPAFAGAALSGEGIDAFLCAMDAITDTDYEPREKNAFAARAFKVRHDAQGMPQVYLKITDGQVRLKEEIATRSGGQKLNDLRLCHGPRLTPLQEAMAGDVVCVCGLRGVAPGDGVGAGPGSGRPATEAMTAAAVTADESLPKTRLVQILRMLEEEDPALRVRIDDGTGEISLRLMGEIQTEVLSQIAKERFGTELRFGPPKILYRETIAAPSVGVGHYEPLRHYAEVWLRLVPLPRGRGIQFVSHCHVDHLALNWQRLIETHVFEKEHVGVLTGAPITDICVELLAGRAHLKHTEGGDFRESTYRAIRNGLMYAQSLLLEPICRFSVRVPAEDYGRVAGELAQLRAQVQDTRSLGEWVCMEGTCPLRTFYGYPARLRATTHGRGAAAVSLSHYAPAENAAEVIEAAHYSPTAHESPDSVFCSHGAGVSVPWNEVRGHAHCKDELDDGLRRENGI